jgi:hypothetical protein
MVANHLWQGRYGVCDPYVYSVDRIIAYAIPSISPNIPWISWVPPQEGNGDLSVVCAHLDQAMPGFPIMRLSSPSCPKW